MPDPDENVQGADDEIPRLRLRYSEETYATLGACFAIYRDKGCGFLEAVYQECLEIELAARDTRFIAQQPLRLHYRGNTLRQVYSP